MRVTERHESYYSTSYKEPSRKRKYRYPWQTKDHSAPFGSTVSLLSTFKSLAFMHSYFYKTCISLFTFQHNHIAVLFLHSCGCFLSKHEHEPGWQNWALSEVSESEGCRLRAANLSEQGGKETEPEFGPSIFSSRVAMLSACHC